MARKPVTLLIAAALIVASVGCTLISVLSGPRTLTAGDTATYVLALGGGTGNGYGWLWVVAEVPDSWSLLSNSYTGTIGEVTVSGSGTVTTVPSYVGLNFPPVADGFQRLCVEIWEGPVNPGDSGELTFSFDVVDVPEGEFALKFWFVASGFDGTPGMGPPAFAAINREKHAHRFAGALTQVAGALERNRAVASSSDGRSVVLGGGDYDISVVDRNPLTGALSHNQYLYDYTLYYVEELAFAPDDQQVYGVGGQRLACFQRDAVTGQLEVSQILQDDIGGVDGLGGAHGVAISEDGASVYVAAETDDAVSVFDRDPLSGDMNFVEAYFNDTGGISGMHQPVALAVSPDRANVYVAGSGSSCIVVFDRYVYDGTLTYSQSICSVTDFSRPSSLVVAPDGNHVYSTGRQSHSVAVFSRDPSNGQLTFVEAQVEGTNLVTGLIEPNDLALSPDGEYLLVAGSGSLLAFSRDASTGSLTFLNADFNQEGGVTGMPVPYKIAISADGSDLFYGSDQSMVVFTTRTFADGFETGDTSAWSAVVP